MSHEAEGKTRLESLLINNLLEPEVSVGQNCELLLRPMSVTVRGDPKPACGSSVYSYAEFDPDAICISIGCFADPSFPAPQYSIWERYKHPWVRVPGACEIMDSQP